MVRLVRNEYEIKNQDKKRPCNQRLKVKIITKENLHEIQHTEVFQAIQEAKMNLCSVRSIPFNNITSETRQAMAFFRDNNKFPDGWEAVVISNDSNHGGIPMGDGSSSYEMDIISLLKNRKHENLRLHGNMRGEQKSVYKHATIVNEPFTEEDLVTVNLPVQVGGVKKKLKTHQFLYGTCTGVLASFPFWKDIEHLFEVVNYYLVLPNLNYLLIRKDTNKYVKKMRKTSGYKPWVEKVNLSDEKIKEVLKPTSTLGVSILYKMVSVEKVDGKMVIFFVPVQNNEVLKEDNSYSWAYLQISNMYKKKYGINQTCICVAALATVCDDGIAPVKIQRDPPIQLSVKDGKHNAGSVQISLSNHKYTDVFKNNNCPYRVGNDNDDDETEGPLLFPGNMELQEKDIVLMKEVNKSVLTLQDMCTKAIDAGKGNLVEDVLLKINAAIMDVKDSIVTVSK